MRYARLGGVVCLAAAVLGLLLYGLADQIGAGVGARAGREATKALRPLRPGDAVLWLRRYHSPRADMRPVPACWFDIVLLEDGKLVRCGEGAGGAAVAVARLSASELAGVRQSIERLALGRMGHGPGLFPSSGAVEIGMWRDGEIVRVAWMGEARMYSAGVPAEFMEAWNEAVALIEGLKNRPWADAPVEVMEQTMAKLR
ncbi:MAG: hypothetical protein IOD15_10615 [Phycisphaerales bacterium]|jgi:hypothetical protein|nr:hypothetical protein [Phycisphaerales bacterium]